MGSQTRTLLLVALIILTSNVSALANFDAAELAAMQHFGVTPPVVTPAMTAHSTMSYALSFIHYFYSMAVVLILLQAGFTSWLARKVNSNMPIKMWPLLVAVYVAIFEELRHVIALPYHIYAGYSLPHSFGLSHQTLVNWWSDWVKEGGIEIVIAVIAFVAIIGVIRRFPKRWTLILWGVLSVFIAIGIFVEPLVFEPLFNRFTPMAPSPLRSSIQKIAAQAGIPNAPILIVDKSRQTTTINAYVTGIGSSARIVLWDNTIKRLPEDQILAVVAHETGHYVLGHIYWGFAITSGGLFIVLMLVSRFHQALIERLPRRWDVTTITDLTAIPVIILGLVLGGFLIAPIDNGISRIIEHQADAFGLSITHNGPAMARAFVTLSEHNLSDPDPPAFVRFWLFSHPPLRERIDFCLGLHPDGTGL